MAKNPQPAPPTTVKNEESIARLEANLAIDPNALDEALLSQPSSFYEVAKQLALLVSRRDAAKQDLSVIEANVDASIREDAAKHGDKVTEKEIESLKKRDPTVIKATNDLHVLNQQVGEMGALKEAFQQRSMALKSLVELHVTNYYSASAEAPARARTEMAHNNRQQMNRARREM